MANYQLGRPAEKAFLKQFGGTLITDKQEQARDLDVMIKETSYSIKHHISSKKTNNLSFELEQSKSTDPSQTKPGNYVISEADKYAHLCWVDDAWHWWLVDVQEVKKLVGMGEKFVVKSLSFGQRNNGDTGYNRSRSIIVPVQTCIDSGLGVFTPLLGDL